MLVTYSIKTCLLITICTITALSFLVSQPLSFTYSPPYQMACYLYANALLSTLNSRETLREKLTLSSANAKVSAPRPGDGNVLSLSSMDKSVSHTTILVSQETWTDAKATSDPI
jgi:hypothetical protein